jgi:thioredoxin-dependent peroxiredoxin
MTRFLFVFLVAALTVGTAHAALKAGDKAPDFTTQASLGGKVFAFSLGEALSKGPVVLYFYPEAFTSGCTIEAHEFAAVADQYRVAGATIIGLSHDGIEKLKKFSVSECRNKFAVGADEDQKIMKAYDAVLKEDPTYSDRTSYVIAPDGVILYAYTNMDHPREHVTKTLAAVQRWAAAHRR